MHEVRGRLGFPAEPLPHLGFASQMGMQHFDHDRATQGRMLGIIDMRHTAAAHAANDAVSVAREPPQICDLSVGRFVNEGSDRRQGGRAASALDRDGPIPRAAVWAKQGVILRTA